MPKSDPPNHRWRQTILLAVCTSLISLVGAEGFLRAFDLADPPAFESNPQYGYLMRPNQSVSTRGHRFQINQSGFRGPDFTMPKPIGVFRLVFLGDSITYGGGEVPDQDLFVNRVASGLASSEHRKIEAINLSVPGWGIQNMAAFVTTRGLFDPDLVIWVISSSDFRRPETSLEENGFLEQKSWSRLWYVSVTVLRIARFSLGGTNHWHKEPATLDQNLRSLHSTLRQMRQQNIPCAVVVVPAAKESSAYIQDLNRFRSVSESLSVPFLETGPALKQYPSDRMFLDGYHLSARGHAAVGDAITSFLRKSPFYGQAHHRYESDTPKGTISNS